MIGVRLASRTVVDEPLRGVDGADDILDGCVVSDKAITVVQFPTVTIQSVASPLDRNVRLVPSNLGLIN